MKKPPLQKVYEAISALASNRVTLKDNEALVKSSDGSKVYLVKWHDDDYTSNDNASFWQGYPGYPIIAVLLLKNKVSFLDNILPYFKDINWHELNIKYKRNYDMAIKDFLDRYDENIKKDIIDKVNTIYGWLFKLNINVLRKIV